MSDFNRYREEELENKEKEIELNEEIKEGIEETKEELNQAVNDDVKGEDKVLDDLETEVIKLTDALLRNRAELENFKRRNMEERIRDRKYALQDFLSEFINITDIFDQAVSTPTEDEKLKNYLLGFQLINNQINEIFTSYGVKKIDALGKKFDPSIHSAVETLHLDDYEDDIIVEEIITGYLYQDRVLRPAMVKVNKKTIRKKQGGKQ